jgi:hypothetical protein
MLGLRRGHRAAAALGGAAGVLVTAVLASPLMAATNAGANANARPQDLFTGTVSAATGAYARNAGTVVITLAVPTTDAGTRSLTLSVRPGACPASGTCLRLSGKPAGTLTSRATVPDAGFHYRIRASGRVSSLGHVKASGTIQCPGNIGAGHETMTLKLRANNGSVTITATSPVVPGFSHP